jgi:hypothetical protein
VGLSHILCEREGSRRFPSNRVKRNKAEMVIQGKGWQDLDKKRRIAGPSKKEGWMVHPWGYEVDKQPSEKDDWDEGNEEWKVHPRKKDDCITSQISIKTLRRMGAACKE